MEIAKTPKPPYYAVIFSSLKTDTVSGYDETSKRMVELASQQPGYLGYESARDGLGITVSYWATLDDIGHWKRNAEHLMAQKNGRNQWYESYKVRICKVELDYNFGI
jgi:heme-degrading monooxygenase HmoA